MNQKQIGIILIIIGLVIGVTTFYFKVEADKVADAYMGNQGTCFLEDGTCLHDQNNMILLVGWIIAAALLLLGAIILFIFPEVALWLPSIFGI